MKHTIYKITNLINGKIYIGKHKTKNINDGYMGSGKRLIAAIEKYGIICFDKEILFEYDTEEEMNSKEKELVTEEFCKRSDTYNICEGGNGGFSYINRLGLNDRTGIKHTEETKDKCRAASTGHKHSETTRNKLRDGHIKNTQPEFWIEHQRKMNRASHENRIVSDETKKKTSDAMKAYWIKRKAGLV